MIESIHHRIFPINEEAEALKINYSQVLQDALMQKLGI